MWRRHLNSEVLATTTHRKPGEVYDGTGTQVISQTIDKCSVKMIQRELYNVKDPLWKRDQSNSRKKENKLIYNCMQSELIYMNAKLLGLRVCSSLSLKFNSNLLWTCENCCPNSLRPNFPIYSLQIYCLGLIGPLYYTFGPQIEILQSQLLFYILISQNDASSRLVFLKKFGNYEHSVCVYRTYCTQKCRLIFHYFIHLSPF